MNLKMKRDLKDGKTPEKRRNFTEEKSLFMQKEYKLLQRYAPNTYKLI
jgi:hypothetical protein